MRRTMPCSPIDSKACFDVAPTGGNHHVSERYYGSQTKSFMPPEYSFGVPWNKTRKLSIETL